MGFWVRVALTRRFTLRLRGARTQWVFGRWAGNRRRSCGLFAPGFVLVQHQVEEEGGTVGNEGVTNLFLCSFNTIQMRRRGCPVCFAGFVPGEKITPQIKSKTRILKNPGGLRRETFHIFCWGSKLRNSSKLRYQSEGGALESI